MALDAQRNWTVSMAENLEKAKRSSSVRAQKQEQQCTHTTWIDSPEREEWKSQPIYLPDEILNHILEYTSQHRDAQGTLASCCLLSRQWYTCVVPLLYRAPLLYGKNFDPFVRAICPSINLHVRKSPLSSLVRVLDMSGLVHQGSKSMTARLLGRTKANLEAFVAPQASFAMNCFPALSKCNSLKHLDLSLVSESAPLPELLKAVSHLDSLKTFRLPRSAGFGVHYKPEAFTWPTNLEELSLSGGIDAHFLHGVVVLPQTLKHLTIEHCPQAKGFAVKHLLRTAVQPLPHLKSLKLAHMQRLSAHALDDVLILLPQVRKLSVSVDYITPALFDEGHFQHVKTSPVLTNSLAMTGEGRGDRADGQPPSSSQLQSLQQNSLHTLELTNSGNPGVEDKISPIDILIAIDEGSLPKLRVVRVASSLLWHSSSTKSDMEDLADVLQEAGRRDWETSEDGSADAATREKEEDSEKRTWERNCGVWVFDDRTGR